MFVDGCFWHGCPLHGRRSPSTNSWYWVEKIATNKARDAETDELLVAAGWRVVRVWEHEDAEAVALDIETLYRMRMTGATR